jgi:hypothetical protein
MLELMEDFHHNNMIPIHYLTNNTMDHIVAAIISTFGSANVTFGIKGNCGKVASVTFQYPPFGSRTQVIDYDY